MRAEDGSSQVREALHVDDLHIVVIDAVVAGDFHLFDASRHVDSAATPDAVCARWWVAHAIQDFYAHSNYVELSLAGPGDEGGVG